MLHGTTVKKKMKIIFLISSEREIKLQRRIKH